VRCKTRGGASVRDRPTRMRIGAGGVTLRRRITVYESTEKLFVLDDANPAACQRQAASLP